jgi:hypothetical protein
VSDYFPSIAGSVSFGFCSSTKGKNQMGRRISIYAAAFTVAALCAFVSAQTPSPSTNSNVTATTTTAAATNTTTSVTTSAAPTSSAPTPTRPTPSPAHNNSSNNNDHGSGSNSDDGGWYPYWGWRRRWGTTDVLELVFFLAFFLILLASVRRCLVRRRLLRRQLMEQRLVQMQLAEEIAAYGGGNGGGGVGVVVAGDGSGVAEYQYTTWDQQQQAPAPVVYAARPLNATFHQGQVYQGVAVGSNTALPMQGVVVGGTPTAGASVISPYPAMVQTSGLPGYQ